MADIKKSISNDFFKGIDRNFLGLITVVLISALFVVVAGFSFDTQPRSVGYCDIDYACDGIGTPQWCFGARTQTFDCQNPVTSPEDYRLVETKCALQANVLCRDESIGETWSTVATYENKTCQEWYEEDIRIELIGCNEIFPTVFDYENL